MANEAPSAPAESIAALSIDVLVARIGGDEAAPGAGAAGAVALALAAACACKAVAISLKHAPGDAELGTALACFANIARSALADADRDAVAFESFIHGGSAAAINQLVCQGEEIGRLLATLLSGIDAVEPKIRSNMMGDLVAAKALSAAAQRIRQRNEGEALQRR